MRVRADWGGTYSSYPNPVLPLLGCSNPFEKNRVMEKKTKTFGNSLGNLGHYSARAYESKCR